MKHLVRWKNEIKTVVMIWVIGSIVYFPILTQKLANPDAVWNGIITKEPDGWEIALGRFGLWIYDSIRGYHINPFINTCTSLIICGMIAAIVCKMLEVPQRYGVIVGAVLLTAPNIMDLLTYYYCSSPYMLAYFSAVGACYFFTVAQYKRQKSFLLGCLCITISLSIYQAYLFAAISMCILITLNRLFKIKKEADMVPVMKRLGMAAAGCVTGTAVYLILSHVIQQLTGNKATTDLFKVILSQHLGEFIREVYSFFFQYYFTDDFLNNTYWKLDWINSYIFLCIIAACVVIGIQRKIYQRPLQLLVMVGCIVFFPIALMGIHIMSGTRSVMGETGILMLPAMQMVYVWGVSLVMGEGNDKGVLQKVYGMGIIGLLVIMCIFSVTFQKHMRYQKERYLETAELIHEKIEEVTDGDSEARVMVIGTLNGGKCNYPNTQKESSEKLKWTVATKGMVWDTSDAYLVCWYHIFRDYLKLEYGRGWDYEYEDFMESGQYDDMPLFPEEGSVVSWRDMWVVKLSEINNR